MLEKELIKELTELVATHKTWTANQEKRFKELQGQMDAIDLAVKGHPLGGGGGMEIKNWGSEFTDSAEFKAALAANFSTSLNKITAAVGNPFSGRKTIITTTSGITAGTTGVTMPQRLPGVTGIAQQALRIRDLIPSREMTTGNAFDFVQQSTRTNNASPQVETSPKGESTYGWNTVSDTVKTIAHFVNLSKQAIEDVPWLQGVINSELLYGLELKTETEILSGDGLGQHMNGLIKQATAYNSGLYNVSGDTKLDKLRHAKLQARLAGLATFEPDGMVLNPTDMHAIELIKDENGGANKGRYIIGDPKAGPTIKLLWGLPVVESDSIAAGTFLVGAFGTGAEIIDRMQATVSISWEHNVNFTSNLCTILVELRAGIAVRRPQSFIYGSY